MMTFLTYFNGTECGKCPSNTNWEPTNMFFQFSDHILDIIMVISSSFLTILSCTRLKNHHNICFKLLLLLLFVFFFRYHPDFNVTPCAGTAFFSGSALTKRLWQTTYTPQTDEAASHFHKVRSYEPIICCTLFNNYVFGSILGIFLHFIFG